MTDGDLPAPDVVRRLLDSSGPVTAEEVLARARHPRQRRGPRGPVAFALAVVALVAVAVLTFTSITPSGKASHPPTPGPVACLGSPVRPSPPPGGWLPVRGGVTDWDPEAGATSGPPSAVTTDLAHLVAARIGGRFGRTVATDVVRTRGRCVIERDVDLIDPAGDAVDLQVLQLGQPFSTDSFPVLGYGENVRRATLSAGTVVVTAHSSDNSAVGVFTARRDGLFVSVIATSSAGAGQVVGYPTTLGTERPGPYPPSPITLAVARSVALAASSFVARR